MKIKYGERIRCQRITNSGSIALKGYDSYDRAQSAMFLSPEQARKLARKLNQAASAIEIRELGRFA